jgi:GTPase
VTNANHLKSNETLHAEPKLSDVERDLARERARQKLETRIQGGMRAYLVSLESHEDVASDIQESLVELGALVRSLGDSVEGVTVQKKQKVVPATFIGLGKAEEIALTANTLNVNYIVFDQEVSPTQMRNLEKILNLPVLDRAGLILQIFRQNAKTREAKTQVEIAQLEYLAPRISNAWVTFERQRGGGSKTKGAGETQLEMDKRRMKDRVASLRKDLEKIAVERKTQRKARADVWNVVLVGYTNAGKTSLMNTLTDSQLSAKDALFETLDSQVRVLKGAGSQRILLTDTVGFIRNLPHGLVASFRSTLEEAAHADLLLHVVDVSHAKFRDHIRVTDDVLKEVGAGEVPRLYVFNKSDLLLGEPHLPKIISKSYPNSLNISAQKPEDATRVKHAIEDYFTKEYVSRYLKIPHEESRLLGVLYQSARVDGTTWTDDCGVFRVRISQSVFEKFFENYTATEEEFLNESEKHK